MIDLLIPGFEERFVSDEDHTLVNDLLDAEKVAMLDADHLEEKVIGPADHAWDYSSLDAGFLRLVSMFMDYDSGASFLFLRALRELGADRPEYEKAVILIEYPYYACLTNDFYNYHDTFTQQTPDRREAGRLTQLRYAGQYLSKYPAYLLIRNELGVTEEVLARLHRLFADTYVTLGINRGQFLTWCRRGFEGVTVEHYLQNSTNGVCNYMWLALVLAADLANVPQERMEGLKRALAHLSLAAKLDCERRLLGGALTPPDDDVLQGALVPIVFQGFALLEQGVTLDTTLSAGQRFPSVYSMVRTAAEKADGAGERTMGALKARIDEHLDGFVDGMKETGLLPETARELREAFLYANGNTHAGC